MNDRTPSPPRATRSAATHRKAAAAAPSARSAAAPSAPEHPTPATLAPGALPPGAAKPSAAKPVVLPPAATMALPTLSAEETASGVRLSHRVLKALNPLASDGQIGGHVKRGCPHPTGQRTGARMALVSALPLAPGSDRIVLAFLDRSDPVETFDNLPGKGDNAVIILPASDVALSVIHGVCPGDWKGTKVRLGPAIREPGDLDVDPTALGLIDSDRYVELIDELDLDGSKLGGYPLWQGRPEDLDAAVGAGPWRLHHRLTSDLVDFDKDMGEGVVIYVFVSEDGTRGAICWQRSGGGKERTYAIHADRRKKHIEDDDAGGFL